MNLLSTDNLIIYSFLFITLILGVYSGIGVKTIEDYALAKKRLSSTVITITLLATMVGGGSIFGELNELYRGGILYGINIIASTMGIIIFGVLVAPKFDERFDSCLSIGDVIKYFYGNEIHKIACIFACLFAIGVLSAQMTALANFVKYSLEIDYVTASLMVNGIIIIYSSYGGVKSVAFTDLIQFLVFMAIFPVVATSLLSDAGGINAIYQTSVDIGFWKVDRFTYKEIIDYIAIFILFLLPFDFDNALIQRFLMLEDKTAIKKINYAFAAFQFSVWVLMIIIFFSALTLYPEIQSGNEIIPTIMKNSFSKVCAGLMVSAIIAILMSTIDSMLNSAGIILTHNIINFSPKHKLLEVKVSTFLLGFIAMLISLNDLPIMMIIILSQGIITGAISIPLTAGLFNFKVDKISYYTCAIPSSIIFVASVVLLKDFEFLPALIGDIAAVLSFTLVYIFRKYFPKRASYQWTT